MTPPAPVAQGAPGRVRVFGGVLATDRVLPGLPVAPSSSDGQFAFWDLTTEDATAGPITHIDGITPVGRQVYGNGIPLTLGHGAGTSEIVIGDTGRFTLDAGGTRIRHHAPIGVDRAAVALDLIGVVLPLALHHQGAWCLHASAVQTQAGVIAFVAASGTGKSTLAAACMQAGCALVSDDVVVLREGAEGITVTPAGLPVRVRETTARAVGAEGGDADAWGKVRIEGAIAQDALPLTAIYVLQPLTADAPVQRVPRATRAAALALLANGKITELLGADAGGDALSRCVSIAHRTDVYDLAVPRDLARLPEVTAALLGWHVAAGVPAT